MDLDSLQLTNKSYVSADMKEFHNDIVFSFSLQSHPGYAFCMIEHQSTPDRMLPLRFLQYQVNLIEDYLKDKPADTKWPIIIPICLYHNPDGKCYPYETKIHNWFIDPILAKKIGIFTTIHLKDYNRIPDTELDKHKSIRLMEKLLKYSRHENAFNILVKELEEEDIITILQANEYWKQCYSYILHVVAKKDKSGESTKQLITLFKEKLNLTESETETMETIAEALQREGIEKGIERGRKQGMFDVAKNMLQRHVDMNFIRDMTGLSVEQIGSLQPAFA